MIFKLMLVLGSVLVKLCYSQEDYCGIEKEICGEHSHIRCNMSINTMDKFYPGRLLAPIEKEFIVNEFNTYRAIYKKMAIEWNNEFEDIAKGLYFVSQNLEYCYATKEYPKVFTVDYEIIYRSDRNIVKAIQCLIETNANVIRVDATQIGCIVYSPNLKAHENPFLHPNYRIFCILNGELVDDNRHGMYNKCINGKRDKIDLPIDNITYDYWSLMVQICIWALLVVVIYLIVQIGTLLYVLARNRNLITEYFENK